MPLYLAQAMLEYGEIRLRPCFNFLPNVFFNLLVWSQFLRAGELGPGF